MAMPGYFIEVAFTDGSIVTTYATVIGEWYYFYSDKRYRFTRGTGTNVLLQQYQPIGTNMAWYDINIIQSVDVQQFDPSTAGGGAATDDVYTKEEVDTLIENAVSQIMSNIDEIVAQKVNEAISSGLGENYYTKQETDNRYVKKTGDTMSGQLIIAYGSGKCYYSPDGFDSYINDVLNVRLYNSSNGPSFELHNGNDACISNANGVTISSNNSPKVRVFNNNNSGAICVYDGVGNNNWLEPSQISAWVNGGTVQRRIIFGQLAYNFDTTIQVPQYGSFLVASGTRYGNGVINNYGSFLSFKSNDNSYMQLRYFGNGQNNQLVFLDNSQTVYACYNAQSLTTVDGYTIGSYERNVNIYGNNITIDTQSSATMRQKNTSCYIQIAQGIGLIAPPSQATNEINVYDRVVNRTGRQFCSLAKYVSLCLSDNSTPSDSVIELASLPDTLSAINYVLNGIQDKVEELQVRTGATQSCDYSKAIPVRILAGGGTTRGGGAGRNY